MGGGWGTLFRSTFERTLSRSADTGGSYRISNPPTHEVVAADLRAFAMKIKAAGQTVGYYGIQELPAHNPLVTEGPTQPPFERSSMQKESLYQGASYQELLETLFGVFTWS